MLLALQTLSERLALWLGANTLPLVMLGMGFALWWRVLPEPSAYQLGGLGLFGIFALLMLAIRRR